MVKACGEGMQGVPLMTAKECQHLTSSQWITKVDTTNHKAISMLAILDAICY